MRVIAASGDKNLKTGRVQSLAGARHAGIMLLMHSCSAGKKAVEFWPKPGKFISEF